MSLRRCIVLALVLAAAGCSSSNSGGGPGGTTCGNNTTVRFKEPCATCIANNCSSQASSCYGSGWHSANFGGTCGPFLQCLCSCGNNNMACMNNCASQETAPCNTCQNDVQMCETQHCQQQCFGSVSDAGTD